MSPEEQEAFNLLVIPDLIEFQTDGARSGKINQRLVPFPLEVTSAFGVRPAGTYCLAVNNVSQTRQARPQGPDWMQMQLWQAPHGDNTVQYTTPDMPSVITPADSANPGLIAVVAAVAGDPNTLVPGSGRGPTRDGRTKPDIVASEVEFLGRTIEAPAVAGALTALVRQRFPDYTPGQVAGYLKANAEARGAVPNNTWGYGLAHLPATDVGGCGGTLSTDGTTTGEWSAACQSQVPDRGYSQYYTFTLEEAAQVTINLTSSVDPYLFLRKGEVRSGEIDRENDDIEAGANLNSRITATLPAGTYTIEATTYDTGKTGGFTLTISGLGGETESGTDQCADTITADDSPVSGTWAAGCQSAESGRGYARYYSFTTTEARDVTITLKGSVDPYLYLRSGDRTGSVRAQNDDHGTLVNTGACASAAGLGNTDSCITIAGLSAGTYTIEATTYNTATAGSFTLTVNGLTGTTTGPGTGDGCGDEITGDGPVSGTWAAGCQSAETGRGYARYYSFTTTEARDVTITLKGSVDPYLYLRSGDETGSVRAQNDDHGTLVDTAACASPAGLGDTDSCITIAGLSAGTYTIEATTYNTATAGNFTLTVSGLGAVTPSQSCTVGLTLDPGQGCSHQDFTITVESSGMLLMRFTGDSVDFDNLSAARSGNRWTIESLP